MASDGLPQLPRMLHASRMPDVLVAAQDDERLEPVLLRAIRVRHAVAHRVLARQERDDLRSRDVTPEVDDQVPEVVLFLRSDGAVRQEDVGTVARQIPYGVVGIDPGIHAGRRFELGSRGPELGGDDRVAGPQRVE